LDQDRNKWRAILNLCGKIFDSVHLWSYLQVKENTIPNYATSKAILTSNLVLKQLKDNAFRRGIFLRQ